jgi:predicted MFS family arabinose efflux permease
MQHSPVDDDTLGAEIEEQAELQAHTSDRRATVEIVAIAFATITASLYQSVLIPLLGVLPERLGHSASAIEWLLTSTLVVAAVATPVMGRLGDMYGKRRLLLVAVALGIIGSALCGSSSSLAVLITGRAFQGASMAALPLAISLAASLLPPSRRATGIAIISASLGLGGAIGMPLSGVVADHLDFHWLFWFTFAAGVASFIAIRVLVPESPLRTGGRLDLLGAVLLSLALVTFLLPLAESGNWGWGSPAVICLFVVSALLFALFTRWQLRTREPLVDLVAARRKPLLMVHLASLLIGVATFASYLGTTVYVEMPRETGYGFGASITVGGLCMLPSGLIMIPAATIAGRLINSRGATFVLALGAAIMTCGWIERIALSTNYFWVIVGVMAVGTGIAMCSASLPAIVNAHTPVEAMGAANSLNNLVRSVGASVASAIGGTVMATIVLQLGGVELPSVGAFRVLFGICATASLIAVVIALRMPQADATE